MDTEAQITEVTPLKDEYSQKNSWDKFKESFHLLRMSPRDLYIAYIMKTTSFCGFFFLGFTLTLYLTRELGFSDWETGILFAAQGVIAAFYSITLGTIPDKYGIKFTTVISQLIAAIGFVVVIFASNRWVKLGILGGPVLMGFMLTIPAIKLAIKRFTLPAAHSIAFSILYIFIWGAAAISGIIVDLILSVNGINSTSFKIIFGIAALFSLITIFFVFFIREIDISRSGDKDILELENEVTKDISFRELLVLKKFWRMMGLVGLLIMVRAIFTHLGTTLPLYMTREMGDDAHFGFVMAYHSIAMMTGAVIFTSCIYYLSNFTLIWIGSVLAALSPLVLLFGANYFTVGVFVTLISIGESIWSPRLLDYTLELAPNGRQGFFLAIASSPFAVAMVVTGLVAGFLLEEFCPEDGERECWKMWLIITAITCISPLLILVFWSCLEQPLHEDNPYISCSKESKKS
jgi:MFS family permease